MHLYSVTLQRPGAITCAVHGNFDGTKKQMIAVSRAGKYIDLLRPDGTTGKLHTIVSTEVFGCVRALRTFRLTGTRRDYLVVGSDSGRITILEYVIISSSGGSGSGGILRRVHQETFGKSGCRRAVPGQYLAADPRGRAVMIAAIEKAKLAYVLNRDADARLTISSPLEAHKAHTVTFDMVGLDVGFENPLFACLEVDHELADEDATGTAAREARQVLAFYELDLGLNHMVRKESQPLPEFANMLIPVPGGDTDGPGGVLVCTQRHITWRATGEHMPVTVALPRRTDCLRETERSGLICAWTMHKSRRVSFFLVQTDEGDLFKLTLHVDEGEVVGLVLKYFDTVTPATSLCLLRTGLLFVAAEFGDHALYQIAQLGDNENEPEFTSLTPPEDLLYFTPRGLLNLVLVDTQSSLAPVTACIVADATATANGAAVSVAGGVLGTDAAANGTPQLYAACGRGARSSLRTLRHGLPVTQLATSDLPGGPSNIWTLRARASDIHNAYIVATFSDATLVLRVGETVEEVTDSGILTTMPTLCAALIGNDALLQVHANGIRCSRSGGRVDEWRVPGRQEVTHAACNGHQVAVIIGGTQVVYFELDAAGRLSEYTERLPLPDDACCLALGPVPEGELRSPFLVAGCVDSTVRLVSLRPTDCLQPLGMQALPDKPHNVAIIATAAATTMSSSSSSSSSGGIGAGASTTAAAPGSGRSPLQLCVGLENGMLMRTGMDAVTGDLADARTSYLGARPVRLRPVSLGGGAPALLALSTRTWLAHAHTGTPRLLPLAYEALDHAAPFSSEQCPEGVVALSRSTLHVLALEELDTIFDANITPLPLTPRRLALDAPTSLLFATEGDHRARSEEDKAQMSADAGSNTTAAAADNAAATGGDLAPQHKSGNGIMDTTADDVTAPTLPLARLLPESMFGQPVAPAGCWSSALRVLDPKSGETLARVPMQRNEMVLSLCLVRFGAAAAADAPLHVIVGTTTDLNLSTGACTASHLVTYRVVPASSGSGSGGGGASSLVELVHRTPVPHPPRALSAFNGRLLAGCGRHLRLYDMGIKRLLLKCETRRLPACIVGLSTMGHRVAVFDVREAFFFLKYRPADNALVVFCEAAVPFWCTTGTLLDYSTLVAADKFGNVCVARLPSDAVDDLPEDPTGDRALMVRAGVGSGGSRGGNSGSSTGSAAAGQKFEIVNRFHVGETILSLQRTQLTPVGNECIVYTTLSGSVGALLPIKYKEDVEFFQTLEMHMRQEAPPLCGRDHLAFRSAYLPVKSVIDGDLCETFTALEPAKCAEIAEEMDRTPLELARKLEDMRARYVF
eukprot:UC1_evm1s943